MLAACRNKTGDDIAISVDHNRQTVKVTGLSQVTLNGIKRDSIGQQAWQTLFPVMAMPPDTELRNIALPIKGKYRIKDKEISFTPDTLFKPGHVYFARYYRYDKQISVIDMMTHKSTPGNAGYTELIFKY